MINHEMQNVYLLKNPPITGIVCMYAKIVLRNDLFFVRLGENLPEQEESAIDL